MYIGTASDEPEQCDILSFEAHVFRNYRNGGSNQNLKNAGDY